MFGNTILVSTSQSERNYFNKNFLFFFPKHKKKWKKGFWFVYSTGSVMNHETWLAKKKCQSLQDGQIVWQIFSIEEKKGTRKYWTKKKKKVFVVWWRPSLTLDNQSMTLQIENKSKGEREGEEKLFSMKKNVIKEKKETILCCHKWINMDDIHLLLAQIMLLMVANSEQNVFFM